MENKTFTDELIKILYNIPTAEFTPCLDKSLVKEALHIPEDLREFFMNFSTFTFFKNSSFPIRIIPLDEVVLANSEMFKTIAQEEIEKTYDDRSWSWYFIAECVSDTEEKVVIDLGLENNGKCYDCYWLTCPGESGLIAKSFTDLIRVLIAYDGNYIPWK